MIMAAREPKRLVSEHFRSDGTPKQPFATREAAEAHAERYGHDHLLIYPCDFCGAFHFATRRGGFRG